VFGRDFGTFGDAFGTVFADSTFKLFLELIVRNGDWPSCNRCSSAYGAGSRRSSTLCQRHYLRGLWASGLRLGESLDLWWDRPEKIFPVFPRDGRPMLQVPGELEKGNADRLLPIAPEFALFLLETPEAARTGPVFRLDGRRGRYRDWQVSKIVSKIGKAAGVKVYVSPKDPEKVKYASAHDFRRAFGVRWAARLMPAQLMELMRHESIETTLRFYVGIDAQRTAEAAWAAFDALQRVFAEPFANSFANSAPFGGADAAPPETRSVLENTAPNQTRPGVIRTHDQGIMRTKAVLVIESAKTGVFAVSPVKAANLVPWDEVSLCPGTVP
jgi:Site-specific recombinase XerD